MDLMGGAIPLQIISAIKYSLKLHQLEIIHCNCSLEDSTVFWPWKREVKATTSSLHSLGLLVSVPSCPVSFTDSGTGVDVTGGNPPGMRTPLYDEVWSLQGGDGRRAGQQTQREQPFGEEQKNPLALLVFLPPSCISSRAYHSGAVGYKQPSPAKAVEQLFFWELVGTAV